MPVPWSSSFLQKAGQLTVYNGIERGHWAGVFKYLLHNFLDLTNKKIGLAQEKDIDKANVVMQLSDGVGTFTYDGTAAKAVFAATAAHGKTIPFQRSGEMEKAAVFLPSKPSYNHKNHLIFIAAHELIHAAGLVTNQDHGDDGVFMNLPNFLNGGKINAQQGSKVMPPLFLDDKTHSALGSIW
jgi:hypothetical protein